MSLKDEIKKSVGDHGLWKNMLKTAVDTGKVDVKIDTVKTDSQCSFGKWLYGSSLTEKEKRSEHYKKVQELHVAFHVAASKVAQLAISGHKDGAMKMLDTNGEFTAASAALTTAMLDWLKTTK